MDRPGYLKWRTALGKLHADKAAKVMKEQGYSQESCERTITIIRKLGIKRDEEVQALEDCACMVFIETGFSGLCRQAPGRKDYQYRAKDMGQNVRKSPEGSLGARPSGRRIKAG